MATFLGIVFLAVGCAIVAWVSSKYRAFAAPLMLGFVARAALALVDALVFQLPGQADSFIYDYLAFYRARNGVLGTFEYIETGAGLYIWLGAFLYASFERSRLMLQAINVFFGALVILNVARLTEVLGGERRAARTAAWLTALFPSLIFFSCVVLREVVVTYPLSLSVLYFAKWFNERSMRHAIVAVLSALTAMAFHSGAVALLLAGGFWLVGTWARSVFSKGGRNFGRNTLALLAGGAAIAFVMTSDFGMGKFQQVRTGEIEAVAEAQTSFAKGRAAYLQDMHPESNAELAAQMPLRLVYFLFAPFPWMVRAPADAIGIVDSMFFLGLFLRVWRRREVLKGRRDMVLILAAFVAMALTFAAGVSNYGTAHRHRNKMLPLLLGTALALPARRRSAAFSVPLAPRPVRPAPLPEHPR
jgi:hypothetical protein